MDAKAIAKDQIASLLDDLTKKLQVWAPTLKEELVLFERIGSGSEALLEFSNTKMSPKRAFFPHSEVLLTFDGMEVEEPPPVGELVLFGVRPCDASSLLLLDKVFDAADYPTVYYGRRRKATYLVGMACSSPSKTCFCTDVGGGPYNTDGLDVLLSDVGDRFLVEILTEKGERLLHNSPYLTTATESDLSERQSIASEARDQIKPQVVVEGLKERLDCLFDEPIWNFLHETCLGCGVCTFACPTCHCFDIMDEADGDQGKRLRIWDSCQYPLFTHHSSGHNPRPSGSARMRQRIMHKFHYLAENVGLLGCVGCGRCIRNCPVNIDIRQVLNRIMER